MQNFFYPESIAVVGVSQAATNLASRILYNLKRFGYFGEVYAVGTRDAEVEGYTVYRSVLDIDSTIDLAILLVPAVQVPKVVDECGQKGIKNVIVESGGFREFQGSDSDNERQMMEMVRKHGIRLVGPNCTGVINVENGLCTSFARNIIPFHEGGVSVLSQSGGVGHSYVLDLTSEWVGLNKFISYGNGLDIDEVDIIDYLDQDPGTTVISAYLEGITRGRDFLRVVSRSKKPVVMLKSNTQPSSHTIATSHSAAVKGDEDVLNAAFRQVGVLRVSNTLEWLNVSKLLTLPLMRGNRLAILSRSGGHAVLAADAAAKLGFEVPAFPQRFFEACRQYFERSVIKLQNPLDLGQIVYHPILTHILEETLKLDEFDGVLLIHSYDASRSNEPHQFISQIQPLIHKYQKPVSTILFTGRDERQYVRETYRLPLFRTPFHGVQALSYSRDAVRAAERRRPFEVDETPSRAAAGQEVLAQAIAEKRNPTLPEALALLRSYGVPVVEHCTVSSRDEALEKVESVGYPIALKIDHPIATHKSVVGGIQLNLLDDYGLITGWDKIDESVKEAGIQDGMTRGVIQKMAKPGWEMVIGARRDPSFGPVVVAGSGGVMAGVVNDVAGRVAPLSEDDACDLLVETKAYQALTRYHGQRAVDTDSLVQLIMTVGRIIVDIDAIEDIDLNPVFVHPNVAGLTVVDAKITLRHA